MLPKAYRLKRKSDFKKAYQQGKSIANQYLVLYVLPQSPQAGLAHKASKSLRVGFSVSKKVGCAVERNKIKRRLREAFRPYLGLIEAKVDLIFIARAKIKGVSFAVVEKSMAQLLKKARLID
ncbi:MAG TPA: ribonuclease P protein component [Peptococcaceae bacterium]|nr:ribonuclease P protein component [Peptococcaceae bacterium]HPZ70887.1 ribonuclease P protein component [Peptococcaceae bacterium]HQD54233.1 ribonuclease P protein component [Peptococcaceae bacterium]